MDGIMKNKILYTAAWAICINFIVEALSRRGLLEGVVHMFTAPYIFALNTLVIASTLVIANFFKKRKFAFVAISLAWIIAGVIDYILLCFRKTPFTANDFTLLADALRIIDEYLNTFCIVAIILLIILLIASLVYYWKKSPIDECVVLPIKVVAQLGTLFVLFNLMVVFGLKTGRLTEHFGNITTAFSEYGFAYCFTNSIVDNGIDKPVDYNIENFENIKEIVENEKADEEFPNIIFLQLESFMNPYLLKNVTYSINPVPNFTRLYNLYPSGYLEVPSFGAGTANTEFEVMTGMNLDDFGTGEYPYKTVLKEQTCESVCYNLKSTGYSCHALHNNDGSFYNRYNVFANLGYDTFTSIEYMEECEFNPTGWAKDKELIPEIKKILNSTDNQDFIYAISVQGHGDYPVTTEELETPVYEIKSQNFPLEEEKTAYEYYLGQLKEMDDFIGELVDELENSKEKTILVLYGDHLPGFSIEDEMLVSKDIYKSQYIIWSNYDYGFENENISAFQLSSHVLEHLGIEEGIINMIHQNYKEGESYDEYLGRLTMVSYDILYGDKKVYDNSNPYEAANMKMGTSDYSIENVYHYDNRICVEGKNFSLYSFVIINGKEYETTHINDHTLIVVEAELKEGDVVEVVWHGEDGLILSSTDEYIYEEVKN